jgi:hypothetical protein
MLFGVIVRGDPGGQHDESVQDGQERARVRESFMRCE